MSSVLNNARVRLHKIMGNRRALQCEKRWKASKFPLQGWAAPRSRLKYRLPCCNQLDWAPLRSTLRPPQLHAKNHQSHRRVPTHMRDVVNPHNLPADWWKTSHSPPSTPLPRHGADTAPATTFDPLSLYRRCTTTVSRRRNCKMAASFNTSDQNRQTPARFARLRRAASDHTPREGQRRQRRRKTTPQQHVLTQATSHHAKACEETSADAPACCIHTTPRSGLGCICTLKPEHPDHALAYSASTDRH